MSHKRTRDDALKYLITLTEPFTVTQIAKRLPGVPSGTLSSLVSALKTGGAMRRLQGENGASQWMRTSRMPQSLEGARAMIARARHAGVKHHYSPRRRASAPRAVAPLDGTKDLVALIQEWRHKASVLDRLVADLGLSETDLAPYRQGPA